MGRLFLFTQEGRDQSAVRLGLGRRFLRRRPGFGSAAKCRHEVVRPVGFLAFAPVHVGERCADLPEPEIRPRIRHTFEPGKRYPFGHLLTAQAPEELVRVGEPEGKAEAEVETALGTPLEFFESSSTSAPDRPFSF